LAHISSSLDTVEGELSVAYSALFR